jgi:hypothetical protein
LLFVAFCHSQRPTRLTGHCCSIEPSRNTREMR